MLKKINEYKYLNITFFIINMILLLAIIQQFNNQYQYLKRENTLLQSTQINKREFQKYSHLEFYNDITFLDNDDNLISNYNAIALVKKDKIYLSDVFFRKNYQEQNYIILHEYAHIIIRNYQIESDLINSSIRKNIDTTDINTNNEMLTDYIATMLLANSNFNKCYIPLIPLVYLDNDNLEILQNNHELNHYLKSLDIKDLS